MRLGLLEAVWDGSGLEGRAGAQAAEDFVTGDQPAIKQAAEQVAIIVFTRVPKGLLFDRVEDEHGVRVYIGSWDALTDHENRLKLRLSPSERMMHSKPAVVPSGD